MQTSAISYSEFLIEKCQSLTTSLFITLWSTALLDDSHLPLVPGKGTGVVLRLPATTLGPGSLESNLERSGTDINRLLLTLEP